MAGPRRREFRESRRMRRAALTAVGAVFLGLAPAGPAVGAESGPVVLLGIDAEDCGPDAHGPLENYAAIVHAMLADVGNGSTGVLVLGGGGYCIMSFWDAVGAAVGTTVTYAAGDALGDVAFGGHALLAVVSDAENTPGGLSRAEHDSLTARRQDIATFVNGGGGLIGLSSEFDDPYAYLTGLGSFSINDDQHFSDVSPTAAGTGLGLTDALAVCCWHAEFTSYPAFLSPLAVRENGRAAAIGGVNPAVGEIRIVPSDQDVLTGDSAVLVVSVQDEGQPAVGRPVDLEVQSGPSTGLRLQSTTDDEGRASFSYSSSTAGTDLVGASFTDTNLIVHESNAALVRWAIPNRPPQVDAGPGYSGSEGTPVSLDGRASDPDGDALTLSWSYVPSPTGDPVDPGTTCSFTDPTQATTTFVCTDDGTFYVILTANDGMSSTAESVAVTVLENIAPTLGVDVLDGTVAALGSTLFSESPFSDPGSNDSHTCIVDWDDGSPPSAGVVSTAGGPSCSAQRTPLAAGVYSVVTTVVDDDGAASSGIAMAVIFDPDGGSVAGAGSIDSPPGAYAINPLASGVAKFGFKSRYFKGADQPTGDTDFLFRAGDFEFHSDSYEWLVVSGDRAQYKGAGSVNGAAGFRFLLTAVDGQAQGGDGIDRFRIKIWDAVTGVVVYDNARGTSDDMDGDGPQPILRGQIQIRTK